MWEIYDALLSGLPENGRIKRAYGNQWWSLCESDLGGSGLAMTVDAAERPAMEPEGVQGLSLRRAGECAKSWNLREAALGMASFNAFYNTPARIKELSAAEPYDAYCTRGLDFTGLTVGIVGHLKMPPDTLAGAKESFILERAPQPGDYPDSACEFLLPRCDAALITGSALVNKTLPRLLELCRNAYVILTGPTVPLCPALLELGIDRLAGMAVTDAEGVRAHVSSDRPGPPFPYGETFLLAKDK